MVWPCFLGTDHSRWLGHHGREYAALGLLLLCLGIGSVTMPLVAVRTPRNAPGDPISAMIMACALPFLAYLVEYWALAITLLISASIEH